MLYESLSAFNVRGLICKSVSERLYKEMAALVGETRRRIQGIPGELDEIGDHVEFFFKGENRIIGVRNPITDQRTFAEKVFGEEADAAEIGYYGIEIKDGIRKGTLEPFTLPKSSRTRLADPSLGGIEVEEIQAVAKVISEGTLITREEFEEIRGY